MTIIAYTGATLYVLSGIVFGLLPVLEFRKHGRVSNGRSYIRTTTLVNTGIYSIVRHPQYVTFMLWALAGMLLFQHWIIVLLGVFVFPLTYSDLMKADESAIEEFGVAYTAYMNEVPRVNFMLGIIRRFRKSE
jgi:protein-S-isoprenylcysteine O-methyltransferase Ste14